MIVARHDLAARRVVWTTLSDLYLDTDVAAFYADCARQLASSPYALDELERILLAEVHPALRANLLVVAGAWQGFDADWLATTILRQQARPRACRPWAWPMRSYARGLWRELAPRVVALRAQPAVVPA